MKLELLSSTPNALKLAFTAIRTCYSPASGATIWNKQYEEYEAKNNDHLRLLKQIVSHGHCHDGETSVLTNYGYLPLKDLRANKHYKDMTLEVAQFNSDGVFLGYTGSFDYVQYTGEFDMYSYSGQTANFKVSAGHKMLYGTRDHKGVKVDTIENLFDKKEFKVPTAALGTSMEFKNRFSPEQLRLFGFFIENGTFAKEGNTEMIFHIKKDREVNFFNNLKLPDKYVEAKSDGTYYCSIPNNGIFPCAFYMKDKEKGEKRLPLSLFQEDFKYILESMIACNGSVTNTDAKLYYTSSAKLAADIEKICTEQGIQFRVKFTPNKTRGTYTFTFPTAGNMTSIKDAGHKQVRLKKKKENTTIYCVETPTRFIATKRQGKILIAGNTSTLEHITFSFAASGISRALLAQLTRHRIGFSYSVQSQRYVKFDTAFDYVVPEAISASPAALYEFEKAMDAIHLAYAELRALGLKAEDARSVLPNAATTQMVLTINLRAFLDFYSKRNRSTHAQSEIAEFAELLREKIVEKEEWVENLLE